MKPEAPTQDASQSLMGSVAASISARKARIDRLGQWESRLMLWVVGASLAALTAANVLGQHFDAHPELFLAWMVAGSALIGMSAALSGVWAKQRRLDADCAREVGVSLETFRAAKAWAGPRLDGLVEAMDLARGERESLGAEVREPAGARRRSARL
jgi:hypothetical protein